MAYTFTCIDCSRSFDIHTVNSHTSCVTEHEKYALGATKAGGYAEKVLTDKARRGAWTANGGDRRGNRQGFVCWYAWGQAGGGGGGGATPRLRLGFSQELRWPSHRRRKRT